MQTLKEYTNELYEENNTLWEDKKYWKKLAEKRKYQLQQKENIIKEVREYLTSIETNYSIGCWNIEEDEFIDVKKDILEILDKENKDVYTKRIYNICFRIYNMSYNCIYLH